MEKICDVSNPEVVLKQLENIMETRLICIYLLLKTRNTWYSMNKVRKYIFGDLRYADYTKTKNKLKRDSFRNRNKKWKDADKYTPAHLSYYLLW